MTVEIKKEIKQRYGKIALSGNSDCCCMPGECGTDASPIKAAGLIGYDAKDLESIPQSSILGVGCGAPIRLADLKEGEVVVDVGSGAGCGIVELGRLVFLNDPATTEIFFVSLRDALPI